MRLWTRANTLPKWKLIVIFMGCFAFLLVSAVDLYVSKVEADMQESVIRLHILANSDTYEDQQIKLKVRDRIIREAGDLFDSPAADETVEQAQAEIRENLDWFEEIANDELRKNGVSQRAHASFGVSYFPTKTYQDAWFPAGHYTALRIEIGEGAGQNWWCVLYPPLCFVGVEEPYMEESSKEALQDAMEPEEYELVTQSEEEPTVQIKFKVVEWWQELKSAVWGE